MSQSRRRILELLEEGHITAEEADMMLNELGQDFNNTSEQASEDDSQTDKRESKFTQRFKRDFKQMAEGVSQFVGDTVQRFNPKDVKRLFHFDDHNVKQIAVDWQNGPITVKPSDDHVIKVQVEGKVFNQSDGNEAETLFDQSTVVTIEGDQLVLRQKRKDMFVNATIYVPDHTYDDIDIQTVSGSVKLMDLTSHTSSLQTVNGSVKVLGHEADSAQVETRHGSIKCDDVAFDYVKLETTVGSVHFDGEADEIDTNVVTGTAKILQDRDDASRMDINVTTGAIMLHVPDDMRVNGKAYTSLNSVDVDMDDVTIQELGDQKVKRQMQFFHGESDEPRCDIRLAAKTGNIKVKQS
ncbi:DUF4097 and DUF4098 domain-containing protein YvlB [Alkalibacillus flavidus]|uniref:DUF4097 and DUF4098 domain-containing protein YvlB n=1 Tax=Alkalibacillus flavidus TaxID=546021 RepID=A0ABV2KTP1_9BACI